MNAPCRASPSRYVVAYRTTTQPMNETSSSIEALTASSRIEKPTPCFPSSGLTPGPCKTSSTPETRETEYREERRCFRQLEKKTWPTSPVEEAKGSAGDQCCGCEQWEEIDRQRFPLSEEFGDFVPISFAWEKFIVSQRYVLFK